MISQFPPKRRQKKRRLVTATTRIFTRYIQSNSARTLQLEIMDKITKKLENNDGKDFHEKLTENAGRCFDAKKIKSFQKLRRVQTYRFNN